MFPLPRMIEYDNIAPEPEKVKKIVVYSQSYYALTDSGKLYSSGDNTNGQLGLGNTTSNFTQWQLADTGGDYRVLISRTDGLWEVGNTFNGQLNDYAKTLAFSTDLVSAQQIPMAYDTRSYVVSIAPEVTGIGSGLYVKGQSFDLNGVVESKVVPSLKYPGVTFSNICGGFNNYTYSNADGTFYISGSNATGAPSEPGDGLRMIKPPTIKEE